MIREVSGAVETAAEHRRAHDCIDPVKPKMAGDDEAARTVLVDALVTDAINPLEHLPEENPGGKAANPVDLLALVAGQDVEPAEESDGRDGGCRIAKCTAADRIVSTAERIVSTVDADARHIDRNRTSHQDGLKGHASCEPKTGLFTAVPSPAATAPTTRMLPSPPVCWPTRRRRARS